MSIINKRLFCAYTILALCQPNIQAQTKSVSGIVISADDGQPMVGVTIKGNSPQTRTVTDLNGKFTLKDLKPKDKFITFSFIGMKPQTFKVSPYMKITMQPDAKQITEVVVTGMQQMDRRLFTGASSSWDASEAKIDGLPDISRSLEGKVAGVSVQNATGTSGTAPKIRVRGATSIYGDSKPLWVVDGVIIDDVTNVSVDQLSSGDANTLISSAIAGLNADDIESFQILKDGSATSIYGARAMAGVIVVTTKKGHAGRSHISYTGEYTIRQIPSYREFNIMDSKEHHSVSLSAGTDKAQFYASLSAMLDPGWYKSSQINRYTANLNGSYEITRGLTINMITMASYRKQKAPGTLARTVDAANGIISRDFDINPYSFALNTSRTLDPNEYYTNNYAPFNILHELKRNQMNIDVINLKYQTELKFKPLSELEFKVLGAVKYSGTSQAHMTKDNSNQALAYRAMGSTTIRNNNPYLYADPDNPYDLPISILPNGGIYRKTTYKMLAYDFRATFNWNHYWNRDNYTNLFGGTEFNSIDRTSDDFYGWGMQYALGETPFYIYQILRKGLKAEQIIMG